MTGVCFLNMGGPDSLAAVRPFLYNLFSDRDIIKLGPPFFQKIIAWQIARKRAPKSRKYYELIGGKSPLASITAAQAKEVESLLGGRVKCAPAMRYWEPRTPNVLKERKAQGIKRVVGLSLYPHYSKATSGSSIKDFLKAASALNLEAYVIASFPDDPGYVQALAETIKEGAAKVKGNEFVLVYSAHSLPQRFIDEGDPYVEHLKRSIKAVEKITGIQGALCYQSRSGPVQWLEPQTDKFLLNLCSKGVKQIVVVPLSFVSDHVETLYEIDIQYKKMVAERNTVLIRTPSLNVRPGFIRALAEIVSKGLQEAGWQE